MTDLEDWASAALQRGQSGRAEIRASVKGLQKQKALQEPWQLTSSISGYSGRSLWRDALHLWYQSRKAQLEAGAITCNAAMAACQKGAAWTSAILALSSMHEAKIRPDTISLNTCLGAGRQGRWRNAVALLHFAQRTALRLDSFSLTGLLGACKGQWRFASSLLGTVSLQSGVKPTVEVRNAHLTAHRQNWASSLHFVFQASDDISFRILAGSLVQSKKWQACVTLLQLLRSCRTNAHTLPYTSSITACGREMVWRRAVCMMWRSSEIDLASCSAAVTACERASCWQQALELSGRLHRLGRQTDVVLWNARLSSWVKASEWTAALRAFGQTHKMTLKPDMASFGSTMEATSVTHRWTELLALFTCLRDTRRRIDAAACSTVLRGLNRDNWKAAVMVVEAAVCSTLRPDIGNLASLVNALPSRGWQRGVHMISERPERLTPSQSQSASCLSLSAALFQSLTGRREWRRALVLFTFLQSRDWLCPTVLANAMACLHGAGRRQEGLELFRRAQKEGLRLDATSLSVALSLCDRADFWQRSLSFLSSWFGQLEAPMLGAAVASCSKGSKWLLCASLLGTHRARAERLRSLATMNSVIDAASAAQQWHVVLSQLNHLAAVTLKPDATSVNSALACFNSNRRGEWLRAFAVTSLLIQQRQRPDAITAGGLVEILDAAGCQAPPAAFILELLGTTIVDSALAAELDTRNRAVACMDHLLDQEKLPASICQTLYRLLLVPSLPTLFAMRISELDEAHELQVYSLGSRFTSFAFSQLGLAISAPWLTQSCQAARRSQHGNESVFVSPAARSIVACVAHTFEPLDRPSPSHCQRTVGYGTDVPEILKDWTSNEMLAPVFVEHDRSMHAERHALLTVLFASLSLNKRKDPRVGCVNA